jgi:hypothetical protein
MSEKSGRIGFLPENHRPVGFQNQQIASALNFIRPYKRIMFKKLNPMKKPNDKQ